MAIGAIAHEGVDQIFPFYGLASNVKTGKEWLALRVYLRKKVEQFHKGKLPLPFHQP